MSDPKAESLIAPSLPTSTKWIALVCSCFLGLVNSTQCAGSLNSFGTFSIYYASYYYQTDPSAEVVRNCFFVVFPASCILEGLAFSTRYTGASVPLYHNFGFRLPILLSGAFFSLADTCVWFVSNPYVFAAVYSVGVGAGAGGCLFLCFLECWKHFPSSAKGKVMGVVSGCYAFGPTIWSLLFSFLCNPDNDRAEVEIHVGETEYNLFKAPVAARVPWISTTFGICFGVIFTVAVLLFPSDPSKNQKQSLIKSIASHLSDIHPHPSICPDLKTAMKSWVLWSLAMNMFCGFSFGVFVLNSYKNYGLTKYPDDHVMSTIGGVATALAAVGRVLFSAAMDHYSFQAVFGLNAILQVAAAASITYALSESVYLYGLCVAIGFSTYTGVFSVFVMETSRMYGNEYESCRVGASVMSLIGQSFTLASLATVGMNLVVGEVKYR